MRAGVLTSVRDSVEDSPFRQVPPDEWIASNRSGFAFFDAFPVSEGHALVVPFRLIRTWWDAEPVEQRDLMELVGDVKTTWTSGSGPLGTTWVSTRELRLVRRLIVSTSMSFRATKVMFQTHAVGFAT